MEVGIRAERGKGVFLRSRESEVGSSRRTRGWCGQMDGLGTTLRDVQVIRTPRGRDVQLRRLRRNALRLKAQ